MMKILRLPLAAMLIAVAGMGSQAASVDATNRFPETVSAGQTIVVSGKFDSTRPEDKPVVKLHALGSDAAQDVADASIQGANQLNVKLPDKLPPGRYYLTLSFADLQNQTVPGELRVQASAVQFDAAHPTTAYRSGGGGFDFDVIGQNFSTTPGDDQIYVKGQGPIIRSWGQNKEACDNQAKPCLWVESPEKLHVLGYQAEHYQGPLSLSVRVGSAPLSAEKQLVLSWMSEAGVLIWSVIIFLALAYVIYRLVARGMHDNVIDGQHYSPFWSFFLDRQSNSYSLSKFQLFMFSIVFVFSYLYVFLCRWLVQWQFTLPDVPGNLSAILALSAGTTVAAAGATAARETKGSGAVLPSAADFISIGGQVVPERFQFFVWTLVACFVFLALLISQNPAMIQDFPSIPQGLLYVMGVSAAGYLGGKLTRPGGPVIRNIAWDKTNQIIIIQGENLSSEGDFFIDDKKLPINTNETRSLVTATPQEQASDRSFSTQLKIEVTSAAGLDFDTGEHVFRIVNKDGQFADARFTADPPIITKVGSSIESPPLLSPPPQQIRIR